MQNPARQKLGGLYIISSWLGSKRLSIRPPQLTWSGVDVRFLIAQSDPFIDSWSLFFQLFINLTLVACTLVSAVLWPYCPTKWRQPWEGDNAKFNSRNSHVRVVVQSSVGLMIASTTWQAFQAKNVNFQHLGQKNIKLFILNFLSRNV